MASLAQHERTSYLLFLTQTFQSLEDEMVRGCALRLVSLPLWHALSPGRLQLELHAQPSLAKKWKALARKEAKAAKAAAAATGDGGGSSFVPAAERPEASFLPGVMDELLQTLGRVEELLEVQAAGGVAAAAAAGGAVGAGIGVGIEEEEEEDAGDGLQALLGDEEKHGGDEEGAAGAEVAGDVAAEAAAGGGVGGEGVDPAAAAAAAAGAGGDDADADAAVAGLNGLEAAADADADDDEDAAAAGDKEEGLPAVAPEEGSGRGALRRAVVHCERGVELLIDLLSQLPTRRFVHAVLEDKALLVKARRSVLYRAEGWGERFRQLLDLLAFYLDFPIDDHTGEALKEDEVTSQHYEKVGGGASDLLGLHGGLGGLRVQSTFYWPECK